VASALGNLAPEPAQQSVAELTDGSFEGLILNVLELKLAILPEVIAHLIMIIEDQPALKQMLRSNFEAEGFSVVTCADGEAAEASRLRHQLQAPAHEIDVGTQIIELIGER
jgi:hypothetical protein